MIILRTVKEKDRNLLWNINQKYLYEFVEEVKKKKSGLVTDYHEELDYTGLKVFETTDYHDNNGNYIGFPANRIEYVIDDDINDYMILYYDAYEGAGASKNAIVSNTATGRIVVYSYSSN